MNLYQKIKDIHVMHNAIMPKEEASKIEVFLEEDGRCKKYMQEHNCNAFLFVTPGFSFGGRIFFDRDERFAPGDVVRTSLVKSIDSIDGEFSVVQTRNTRYICLG
ncbi:hypothetical protein CPT_Morttis_224 [Acinetobacter phage Morttis]|nr:hypothetical protein CPT_Maestro_230 [Acinetobacter phage Maestro]QQM18710.1 hypothetical protein CPT_Morttis_224 [Acinetobacter phage Morttis]